MNELKSGMREFSLKGNCFGGYTVMVRYTVPSYGIGCWEWSRWRKAGQSEMNSIVKRLLL